MLSHPERSSTNLSNQGSRQSRPDLQRSISDALRNMRSREEQETLLGDEEQADADGHLRPQGPEQIFCPNPHADLPVYTTIHR